MCALGKFQPRRSPLLHIILGKLVKLKSFKLVEYVSHLSFVVRFAPPRTGTAMWATNAASSALTATGGVTWIFLPILTPGSRRGTMGFQLTYWQTACS